MKVIEEFKSETFIKRLALDRGELKELDDEKEKLREKAISKYPGHSMSRVFETPIKLNPYKFIVKLKIKVYQH